MSAHEVPKALMVEGFRVRRGVGPGGMSKTATITAVMVLTADGLIATQVPASLLVTVPATLLVVVAAVARRHGMSALAYYWAKMSWRRAARVEATSYRRLLLPHPYALDLPGVGASSTLIKAHDPTTGKPLGVVHDRATGHMTITTLLAPGGSLMAPTGAVQSSLRTWSSVLEAMSTDEQ
ncbi:SCO6880 family protein, partial [Streptomyces globosus]